MRKKRISSTRQGVAKVSIPYGRQWIEADDIEAVVEVLRSDWLTTGPRVSEFEEAFAERVRARYAVAVSSGTAALHAAVHAVGIGPGDEVIVPPMTFAATANCVVFQGGIPVFADVEPGTLLLDPKQVEEKITARTKAVIAVDYAGQPCDYDSLRKIARTHGLALIDDACHALGAAYRRQPVGSLADLNTFSFHPVKHITTGEGGIVTTDREDLAERMRRFRNHGISTDHSERTKQGSWFYEIVELGYNYRLTDLQCALGLNQLGKLSGWVKRRQAIAARYTEAFSLIRGVEPLITKADVSHAYHLYVVQFDETEFKRDRTGIFRALREAGVGVNVHYIPVHLHPFYRRRFGTGPGLCPVAEQAYQRIVSLPIFPLMTDEHVDQVVDAVAGLGLDA
ncbi:MAG: UDP-4-amino-4,6-dideoxy-N-acetyl-beta-L-altrosamine transaminase [Desulfomonile tiedjei]|nr:UDP-4-amino-4,6-dideoxy-N-acetyl-beta-L-altrosamine transaminase [Desulfomonile tiedjei]